MTIRIRALIAGSLALTAAIMLAPAAVQAKAPPSFFGISSQTPLSANDYQRMAQGKIGTLRMPVAWQSIQPSGPDDYDFSQLDPIVGGAAQQGIAVEPFISGSPAWSASGLDGYNCAGEACTQFAPNGDQALAAWSTFVTKVVSRYGPNGTFWTQNPQIPKVPIVVWQIWNEQNSSVFFKPGPSPSQYAKLLSVSAAAVRAVDPSATIVLGGMAGLNGSKQAMPGAKYLKKLYKAANTADFDGVAIHPYGKKVDAVIEQVTDFRKVMKKAHDAKASLWVTEIGWGSKKGGTPLNVGTKGQAERVKDAYKYFTKKRKKLRLQVVDYFSWMDSPQSICAWCATSGLFKTGLVAKPSWKAFTKFSGGS